MQIMDDGHPAPKCGDWFLAIHQAGERGDMMNALDEYFDYTLTLTAKISAVPRDRLGDAKLTSREIRTLAKEKGFNAKAQQLKTFLHMNWYVIGQANNYLLELYAESQYVNGFCEPAHWEYTDQPKIVGGEWFGADDKSINAGLVAEIRFRDARRLQAIATFE